MTDTDITAGDASEPPSSGVVDQGRRAGPDPGSDPGSDREIELTIVTMSFDAADQAALLAILAKYVVMTRMVEGCRNVDLCSSVTVPGRQLIVQKWDDPAAPRTHFDSELMVEMATSCAGLLQRPPQIDLWDGVSAHDLA